MIATGNWLSYSITKKSNLDFTRVIRLKRLTNGGAYLCCLTPEQHSFEELSQLWRAIGGTMSDLAGPGVEPQTPCTDSNVVNFYDILQLVWLHTKP